MNFDGKLGFKQTPLRAPGVVLSSGTQTTAAITPSGFSHALFYVTINITGLRSITGKLEHSDDNSSWTDVSGTAFAFNAGLGDGTDALRTILIAHDAVKEYVRASVTYVAGTNNVPIISVLQFNQKNQQGASPFAGEVL
jgi:hypothetical protein